MSTAFVGPAADLLAASKAALDAFTAAPDSPDMALGLARSLTDLAVHTNSYDHVDAELAGRWLDAYWAATDAQNGVKAIRIVQAAAQPVTESDVDAVHRGFSYAMAIFEDAARTTGAAPLPYDKHGRYSPAPGTEYPFSISDIARRAVVILGPCWTAESGFMGVSGTISAPDSTTYLLAVGDLGDTVPELYVELDGGQHCIHGVWSGDGVQAIAQEVALLIRTLR
ncbi:hypothetical protein [Streptomyces sp. NPDC054975]